MSNCNHDEADTRIMVHIQHALQRGMTRIQVRTVDTDVIVVVVGPFYELVRSQPLAELFVTFGMGKNYQLISMNAICSSLGEPRARSLPIFHALTGCDTTLAFKGKGKRSAWQAWEASLTHLCIFLCIALRL